MGPARRIDICAVLIVPNVTVRMGAQHFITDLSFHDSLEESYISFLTYRRRYRRVVAGACEFGAWPLVKKRISIADIWGCGQNDN